ncbi:hypothetical protein I6F30_29765 [Bradyrhizobium sp. NBAIM20]|uniref:hypothetical protein n=1 Tax=unclassified Bradyrhizobium TaxID=2631580 RepID=UPI001CD47EB1|nr:MULTISPECIES: hypothetical protein [unclassified Bradyrhizobium]MCA1415286.1 hypothetical protein [Bradyrhizobium sp. NBAIM20]MCA1461120.1 hypothetical protein [Bradyrhizobium sp. NBAIM18]
MERGAGRGSGRQRRGVVIVMDERAQAILDDARETLARLADVKVERRVHRDDGFSTDWARGMPPKPAPPTMAEVEAKIADAVTELETFVRREITTAKAEHQAEHETLWLDVFGAAIAEERKRRRAEVGDEIEKLRAELAELRADLTIAKAHARGEVVEVPEFLERRRA